MKILTAGEMAAMDRQATEQYGVPSLTLMENAGRCVAEAAAMVLGTLGDRQISIFCGRGNNGGDGLVAARHLLRMGARPRVFLLGSFQDVKGDPAINLKTASQAGVEIRTVTEESALDALGREARGSGLLIDAILGTGFTPPLRGFAGEVISLVGSLGVPVLAVDVPSGLSADSGIISDPSITACATVTFGLPKIGQFLYPAASRYGELYLADIGFPAALEEQVPASRNLITAEVLSSLLLPRAPDSHKGSTGHVLLLAGSWGYVGAAILAARGALRGGAGLVTVALPESQAPPSLDTLPEAMILPLPETSKGSAGEQALDTLLEHLPGKKVLAVGPGISQHPETARLVRSLIPRARIPMVIDADGLNALAGDTSVLLESKADIVITPHPGELGRLLGLTAGEIQTGRLDFAQEFSKKYGVTVVLKGAMTVIATPSGETWINPSGNPGMAAGGMGDVLTGTLAAFIAQGFDVLQSALLAVAIHGRAGDAAASSKGPWGYLAGEVVDAIPAVISDILTSADHEEAPRRIRHLLA